MLTESLHKASGQAIVTLAGRDIYLGRWNDREKHERYRRAIAEWMAAGCPRQPLRLVSGQAISIDQLADAYEADLAVKAESEGVRERVQLSLRPLRSLYGGTPAAEFGPKKLKAVRAEWIRDGISRAVVNERRPRVAGTTSGPACPHRRHCRHGPRRNHRLQFAACAPRLR
jgi:hypothetical protein